MSDVRAAVAAVYRQSALATASCLKRFNEIYNLGLEDDTDETRRGSAFHLIAFGLYVPALVRAGVQADRELLEQSFRDGIVAARCPPHLVDEVEDIVFGWGERFELNLRAFLLAEERQVSGRVSWKPDLAEAFPVTPHGSLLRVTDAKTYHAILNDEAVRREFQGRFYVREAMKLWPGFDVYEFRMAFVRYGPEAYTSVVYEPEDLEHLDRQVEATIAVLDDAAARNDWPAQPGEHCGYCRLKCDAGDDDRCLDRRVTSAEEAAIVASRKLVLQRLLVSDTRILKAWCTTEGPVLINGIEFAHRKTTRVRYSAPLVLQILERHEFPPPPDMTVSKSSLRPILATKGVRRRRPAMVEEIEAIGIERASSRFSGKKFGDQAPDLDDEEEAESRG